MNPKPSKASKQQQDLPTNLTQEELLEFIKKAIKNNQKHFQKDKVKDDIYKGLREQIQYLEEQNNLHTSNLINNQLYIDMVNQLLKMQGYSQDIGSIQIVTKNERSASEKGPKISNQIQQVKISKPTINLSINNNNVIQAP